MTDEQLLTAFSTHETRAEVEHPTDLYPRILARAMRGVGTQLGVPVSDEEAGSLAVSVPDWPAFAERLGVTFTRVGWGGRGRGCVRLAGRTG
jgi:putative hydrolase of the HAD superfamily